MEIWQGKILSTWIYNVSLKKKATWGPITIIENLNAMIVLWFSPCSNKADYLPHNRPQAV